MRKEMGMYRGRDVCNKTWRFGALVTKGNMNTAIVELLDHVDGSEFNAICWEVDPKTVGQQTPFTDRFGQPIFGGMHVKTRSDDYIHCNDSALIGMDEDGMWVISKYEDEIHGMNINWDGFDSVEIIKD